ncbi:hypothetical protein L7F22_053674 [Adiantum nelumboides]|nr:hypothetical protein [Adiantum nelumboides]
MATRSEQLNWQEIHLSEDEASAQGTHALRFLVQQVEKAQNNFLLRPMLNNLMRAHGLQLLNYEPPTQDPTFQEVLNEGNTREEREDHSQDDASSGRSRSPSRRTKRPVEKEGNSLRNRVQESRSKRRRSPSREVYSSPSPRGRDGLTYNMLDLVHTHWKRRRVIKVRCLGVPTLDMDNVCFHLENKTGGKIIHRSGGVVYLFRGRNYNYKDRPEIPLMLWKPLAPVYPKLIKRTPEGLTEEEAIQLHLLGKKIEPLCTLGKNGVYINLVNDVRAAFKVDDLVRINCCGLNPSDYKKIGAKLKAGSEVNNPFHTVLAAQDELNLDDHNLVVQDTRQKVENDTTQCLEEEKALPDAACREKGEYTDSNLLAEDQDGGVATLQTAFALESRSTNLGSRESVEASKEACIVAHVDDLWDQAIASGIAIQIDNQEVDNDIVVKKVRELAKAAPVSEVYTRQLMRLLEPKKQKSESPEKEMHKHIKNICRMRLEKKPSKRSFRMRTADILKELPEDGPHSSGMPVDELARLLSIR